MNSSRAITSYYSKGKRNCKSQKADKNKRGFKKKQEKQLKMSRTIDLWKKVQVDVKPEWMNDMRVVRIIKGPVQKLRNKNVSGYKIVSCDSQGLNKFQYSVGDHFTHNGDIKLCSSGFHFSVDPLQCLRYAENAKLKKPWRLLQVQGYGNVCIGTDKICSQHIYIQNEFEGEEKDQCLTGIVTQPHRIMCYKNGEYDNPAPGVSAFYDYTPFEGVYSEDYKNGELLDSTFEHEPSSDNDKSVSDSESDSDFDSEIQEQEQIWPPERFSRISDVFSR
jgi:hypothetical protein